MKFEPLSIPGAYLIHLEPFKDHRGSFERLFCADKMAEIGFLESIKQTNYSHTVAQHTIRGLHFQHPPYAETKIIRCIEGGFYDVFVDIRIGSPTFLQHCAVELSPDKHQLLFIPKGCAHGFQTLKKDSKMIYFHSENYTPESEGGLNFADPILGIKWPYPASNISDKDALRPHIDDQFKGI